MLRTLLMFALTLVAVTVASARDEKIDAKLLLGKWSVENAPPGVKAVIEFKKDDTVQLEVDANGNLRKLEGTYKVEDDTLEITLNRNGQEKTQKVKILKLTEKEAKLKDNDKGEEQTLKKVP